MIRIGFGWDFHQLIKKRPLRIGGVHIPFHKGEKAHSDGDVLLHAITDALLGAAGITLGSFFHRKTIPGKMPALHIFCKKHGRR